MGEEIEDSLKIGQIRVSRPTNQIEELERFYCEGLGFHTLFAFPEDASGYHGVVLGVPGHPYYLEFCTHRNGFESCRPPTRDNLLVFYLETPTALETIKNRMSRLGYSAVEATNSHWDLDGITFEDPDGWRVVFMLRSNI